MDPEPAGRGPAPRGAGPALLVLLAAVGPLLAFWASGYFPRSYLAVLVVLAAATAVLAALGPLPRLPRLPLVALALFALLAAWTALSMLWAGSPENAWLEADRTLLYLLGFGLATLGLAWTWRRGLLWLGGSVLAGVGLVAAGGVVRLLTSPDPLALFGDGRFAYPISYWNGLACLFMIGAWLALAMASGRWKRWWVEPPLLALAIGLAQLAVLPQSRGALWAFVIVTPAFVALAPHRFRSLTNLALLVGATAWSWSRLVAVLPAWAGVHENRLGTEGALAAPLTDAIHAALGAIALSVAVALVVWGLTYAGERTAGPLSPTVRRAVGVGLAAAFLVVAVSGLVLVDRRTEGLEQTVRARWEEVVSDQGPADQENRFVYVGLTGRLEQWKVAARAFEERPLLGLGAQNFEFYYAQHRLTGQTIRQAHSRPMEVLAELGLPGFLLWFGLLGVCLAAGLRSRFTAQDPRLQALVAGMALAVLSWVVHGAADWFWQLGGVTWPAILLLAGLASAPAGDGERAGEGSPNSVATWTSARGERAVRVAVVSVAAVALLSGLLPYLSLRYLDVAQGLATRNPSRALQAAGTAARLDPLSVDPLVVTAQIRSTAEAWEQVLRQEPDNWLTTYRAGLFFREAGDLPRARALLERASALNPLSRVVAEAKASLPD